MTKPIIAATSLLLLAVAAEPAAAERWNSNLGFRYAGQTQVRVVGPSGYRVSVGRRTDSVPAVFRMANRDGYVWVSVRARNGAVWRRKIEVRRRQETTLRLRHSPTQYSTGVIRNTSHYCQPSWRGTYRFDVLSRGRVVLSRVLNQRRRAPGLRLTRGSYKVRVYKKLRRGYASPKHGTISAHGPTWKYVYGCRPVGPIGKVTNSSRTCARFMHGTYRFRFKQPRTFRILNTVQVAMGRTVYDVPLAKGRYWVVPERWDGRFWIANNGFFFSVSRANWHMNYACRRR